MTFDYIEVPDPLGVEGLISSKLNNRRKLARLIKQYGIIFSSVSESIAFLLQGVTENDRLVNVTNLKYGKYDMTSEKINNNKRLIDRAK